MFDINQALATVGVIGVVILLASIAVYRIAVSIGTSIAKRMSADATRINSEANQSDTVSKLLAEMNAERRADRQAAEERDKAREQSINHLSAELTDLKSKQSFEAGRNTEIKDTMQRERTEWAAERAVTAENIRVLQAEVLELQKNDRAKQEQIKDLNTQIEILKQRIADKDGEIVSLKATLLQLETERTQLLALNTELRKQVDERQARIDNLSSLEQRKQEVAHEIAVTPTPLSDDTIAIPDMRDVDETHITDPQPSLPENTDTDDKKIA
jgi:chromosome segregation ATPase